VRTASSAQRSRDPGEEDDGENIVSFAPETNASGEDAAKHLLHWRYRNGAAPAGPWNEVIATILAHRSVRAFLPDPVPEGTLERLVAAASARRSTRWGFR
jgi:hypothetical protein